MAEGKSEKRERERERERERRERERGREGGRREGGEKGRKREREKERKSELALMLTGGWFPEFNNQLRASKSSPHFFEFCVGFCRVWRQRVLCEHKGRWLSGLSPQAGTVKYSEAKSSIYLGPRQNTWALL